MYQPKAQQKLNDYNYMRDRTRNASGTVGVIQSYNTETNTATVLISSPDSDVPNDLMTNVICPITLGVQNVAPEPGRPCWVVLKGGMNDRKAMISHYFNHNFSAFDYGKQYQARASVPRYQLGI